MCGRRSIWTEQYNGLEPHLALQHTRKQFQGFVSSRGDMVHTLIHILIQASFLHSYRAISTSNDGCSIATCRLQSQSQTLTSP